MNEVDTASNGWSNLAEDIGDAPVGQDCICAQAIAVITGAIRRRFCGE